MGKRLPNWDTLLFDWARNVAGQPFVWGQTDCGSLVREAARVMYGEDVFAAVKPYRSKKAARDRYTMTGGIRVTLEELSAAAVAPAFLQQGDVLICPDGGHGFESAAIAVAGRLLSASLDRGVALVPLTIRPDAVVLRLPVG